MKNHHKLVTTAELTEKLSRPALWIARMRKRFGLPLLEAYPICYEAFLRKVRDLRNLGISEERLGALWELERKLLETLHLDVGSGELPLIEGCSVDVDPERRMLLSNEDFGVPLMAQGVQAGLDFHSRPRELSGGKEMGEDALRILREYQGLLQEIRDGVIKEISVLKNSISWAKQQDFLLVTYRAFR